MSSKTKIVVLHLKELIYTGIFVVLGILFVILLFIMFRSDKETPEKQKSAPGAETQEGEQTPIYQPGAYRSALYLDNETVEINLTVDETNIVSLTLLPLNDKIATLYPLLEPAFNSLAAQICKNQSLENVTYAEEAAYTSQLLLNVIEDTLAKVQVQQK